MEEELQQVQEIYTLVTEFLVTYSFQIIGALIILALGLIVASKTAALVERLMLGKGIDITLSHFTAAVVKILIVVMVAIIALGKVGVSVTPFVAAVGALSLGAGLALQGTLTNYGAGLSIIVTRPFVVGDTITVQGVTGVVKSVHLSYTFLSNEDAVRIMIPNKHIVGEIIHNSFEDSIIETSVDIAYHCDPEQAVKLIVSAIAGVPGISQQRQPQVGIEAFAERGITLGIRFWAKTEQLFQARYQAHGAVHRALQQGGIEIPVPQREVRMLQ